MLCFAAACKTVVVVTDAGADMGITKAVIIRVYSNTRFLSGKLIFEERKAFRRTFNITGDVPSHLVKRQNQLLNDYIRGLHERGFHPLHSDTDQILLAAMEIAS